MKTDFSNFKNTKEGKIILGQIISLLKNIYFVEVFRDRESRRKLDDAGFAQIHSFSVPPHFVSGCSIGWTHQAMKAIENIAEKSIHHFIQLSNGDKEFFSTIIQDIVKDNIANEDIFNFYLFSFDKSKSFFDLSSPEKPIEFAELFWQKIYDAFDESINEWIVIFPLHKVSSQSFSLNYDGIFILNPNDEDTFVNFTSNFDMANRWYFSNDTSYDWILKKEEISWLICKISGTADGAKYFAAKQMRTFIAVLFAHLYPSQPELLGKVSIEAETYSIQFASNRKVTKGNGVTSHIGNLFPPSGIEIVLTDSILESVTNWYKKKDSLNEEQKSRFNVASQFIQYGIIANGLERFIHFFIALDSMFGERHKVETKITEGIVKTFPNNNLWKYKIEKLFDLRSELLHGSCSSITDWKKLDSYKKHCKSNPLWDVITASMTAFRNI